jgi:hypothetical protein
MKFFNFEKKERKQIIKNYQNYGGEFFDDNSLPFNPEFILEKKENLPKFLYRGVKRKGKIDNFEKAVESLQEINKEEDSAVNWQTESMSTTADRNVAFSYALEGEIANKLDLYYKNGDKVFEFLDQNMGRWLLDHYPEKFVVISEDGTLNIDWEKAKKIALKILEEQTELRKKFLVQEKENLKNSNEYNDEKMIKFFQNKVKELEEKISEKNIEKYKESIESMNSDSVQFRIDGKIKDVCLGYLFELEPQDQVRVATRDSVEKFMKHHNIEKIITPGKAEEGSQKEKLTNLMKDAGYHGIDKNSEEKEIGFFNPQDLNTVFGLEIKIINGKLKVEKHILNK